MAGLVFIKDIYYEVKVNLYSSEDDRIHELTNKYLNIFPWNKDKEISIIDAKESVSHAIMRYAEELNIINRKISINGIQTPIIINKKSIKESIASMCRQQSDLLNLAKLFTVIEKVFESCILLQVEPFKYKTMKKAKLIEAEYQYLSAFRDDVYIYPVKISIEKHHKAEYTNAHVIITVGKIEMMKIYEIKKENVAYTGLQETGVSESLFSEDVPFKVNIQQLVKMFNESEGVILKHLPNYFLSKEQILIKNRIINADYKKVIRKSE